MLKPCYWIVVVCLMLNLPVGALSESDAEFANQGPIAGTLIASPPSAIFGVDTVVTVTGTGWETLFIEQGPEYRLFFDEELEANQFPEDEFEQPNMTFVVPGTTSMGTHIITVRLFDENEEQFLEASIPFQVDEKFNIHDITAKVSTQIWQLSKENVEKERAAPDPSGTIFGDASVKLDSDKKDNIVGGFFSATFKVMLPSGAQVDMTVFSRTLGKQQSGPELVNQEVRFKIVEGADDILRDIKKNLKALNGTLVSNPNESFKIGWVFCGQGSDPEPSVFDEFDPEVPELKELKLEKDPVNPGLFEGSVEHSFADPDKGVQGTCELKIKVIKEKK